MPRNITITFADGTSHVYQNAPDEVTPDQVEARASKEFGKKVTALDGGRGAAASTEDPFPVKLGRQVIGAAAGLGAGAGQVAMGAQELAGRGLAAVGLDKVGGWLKSDAIAGRAKLAGELAPFKADSPFAAGAGKLAGEIIPTLLVGGLIAKGLGALPGVAAAMPNFLNAIRTSGMVSGQGGNALAQLGTRAAGGAITSGASAALVDPNSAGMGAVIGGALPVLTKTAGAVGQWIGGTQAGQAVMNAFKSGGEKGASAAIRALGMQGREAELLGYLRSGVGEIVPGSKPTVAQALVGTPAENAAGVYERVVSKSPGGNRLLDTYSAQGEARKNSLEAVAPTNALGLMQAREDLGATIARVYRPEEARIGKAARDLYENIDPGGQAAMQLPLGELKKTLDRNLGPGVTGQGADAFAHMRTANKIGTVELPAVESAGGSGPVSLLDAIKAAGGMNLNSQSAQMLSGELKSLGQDGLGRIMFKNKGQSPARMAEKMHEAGYIDSPDPAHLLDVLRNNPRGTYAVGDDLEAMFQRASDHAQGGVPGAEVAPRAVPWQELQNFRSSLGNAWDRVSAKPGMDREAAALAGMRKNLDAAIDDVSNGGGAVGDVMPKSVVDAWREANKSFQAYQQRFHEGPQSALFKVREGQPLRQGGEIPGLFWGSRPGLADDVRAFRKLTEDSPAMLGQFKSMITTEGLSTQTKTGQELSAKFPAWVDQHITGLREALSPAELESVQRIAQDIQRALKAGVAGKGPGGTSDTFQLGANALNGGLLDSTAIKAISHKMPFGQAVRGWGAERVGMSRARNAAGFLADSSEAANMLAQLAQATGKSPNALQRLLSDSDLAQLGYRVTPALAAGR